MAGTLLGIMAVPMMAGGLLLGSNGKGGGGGKTECRKKKKHPANLAPVPRRRSNQQRGIAPRLCSGDADGGEVVRTP